MQSLIWFSAGLLEWLITDPSQKSPSQVSMIFCSLYRTFFVHQVKKVWLLRNPQDSQWSTRRSLILKGKVHTNMKLVSSFTHPNVVPNLYDFFFIDIMKNYAGPMINFRRVQNNTGHHWTFTVWTTLFYVPQQKVI